MAVVSDSDEVQRLQEAVEENQIRRRAFFNSALDCIFCTDNEGRITELNAAAERTFRISAASVLGKDLLATILPVALQERHRHELLSAAVPAEFEILGNRLETVALRSDSVEFPAELTVNRIVIRNRSEFTVYVRDLTARRRAAEAVVRLAAIVESSQDAIYGGDLQGQITSWNKGAEQMYGYLAEEVLGRNASLLVPPGRLDEYSELTQRLRGGSAIHEFETVRLTKDRRLIDVSLTISPVLEPGGKMMGVSAIARDITARKVAAEDLRKATETSVYASPLPIIAIDARSRVTMWNPAAENLFGWSEQEIVGKPNPMIPRSEARDAARLHQRLLAGETLTGVEVRRQKRDGSLVTISLSAIPMWDQNHKVKGIIKFLTDITESKRSEEALRVAEAKYRSIFENSVEGIYQTTPDGRYISANPALARMLGFESPEELIEIRNDIRNQEYVDPALHAQFVHSMEEHGIVEDFEYQAYRKDGKVIWVSENAHAVKDGDGKIRYFQGTVEDISQHRQLEHQVRQMQKMEAIGRLAGGVAHDFNNILMAISSFAELLDRKLPEQDKGHGYVEEIVKATDRGSSLTRGLLAFSRKQVLSLRVIDLNTLVAEQMEMLKRLISEDIELRFVLGTDVGRVRVDPSQIEQVVMNLVINARDAMPTGGELVIETMNAGPKEFEGEARGAGVSGEYVALVVSDNGCGMDAETKSLIFEPFFTTKEQGKGTGLGLAMVFGIVKQSSGHIHVKSEVGKGASFKIYLPQVQEEIVQARSHTREESFRGDETILLVEDEDAVRASAAEYLRTSGYTMLVASRGSEALELAKQHTGPIHLLVTDLIMPKMSGRKLAERISAIHPETKLVFMSGYSNNLLASQRSVDPEHVFLQKPFRLTALARCIRESLDAERQVGLWF